MPLDTNNLIYHWKDMFKRFSLNQPQGIIYRRMAKVLELPCDTIRVLTRQIEELFYGI
jgi:hypothetical protein